MRYINSFVGLVGAAMIATASTGAQTPAADPSARLRAVLPADVAERVLATIADARSHDLPAAALENRALKFAAKGVAPADIERSVKGQAARMAKSKNALERARGSKPADDEVEAGAEAMRRGVDGAQVSALAKSAPSGRSLAVPLYVIGSLMDRGLPSDAALQRVHDRLLAKASDADLEKMPHELPAQAVAGKAHKPAATGTDLAANKRPANAGGRPSTIPANGGAHGSRPASAGTGLGHRPTP